MKVSVIVPVFNSEKTIQRCLESITTQSYPNFELILIDNNSLDNSREIIKNIQKKDNRIKLFIEKKKGVSNARNLGIQKSTGDYIMFVDSDDSLEKDAIKKMVTIIKKQKCDVVRASFVSNRKTYDKNYKNNYLYNKEEIQNKLIPKVLEQSIASYIWLLIIKKDILKNVSFNNKLFIHQDLFFYLELFHKIDTIYFSDEIIYNYMQNDDSSKSQKYYERNIYNIMDLYEELQKSNYNIVVVSNLCFSMLIPYFAKIAIQNRLLFSKVYKDFKSNPSFQYLVHNIHKKHIRIDLRFEYFLLFKVSKVIYQFYVKLVHILHIKKY